MTAEFPDPDSWITREPPELYETQPTEEDEVRASIDRLMQTAKTAEQWMEICRLCRTIGDEPPFIFNYSPYERMVAVSRSDWDLGMPAGVGHHELAAIADLLEQEENA